MTARTRARVWMLITTLCGLAGRAPAQVEPAAPPPMALGRFSVSLQVRDLAAALAFYQKLDFRPVGGDVTQRWVLLQHGEVRIGLFQGLIAHNLLTFNPGWTAAREPLADFPDVRELQQQARARGLTPGIAADPGTRGPAHFTLTDPDGNVLLFDQHVPSPARLGPATVTRP